MVKRSTIAALIAATALALAGCTASANLTVGAETIAKQAGKALADQLGAAEPAVVDCGDDPVDLVDGEVVNCVLTNRHPGWSTTPR